MQPRAPTDRYETGVASKQITTSDSSCLIFCLDTIIISDNLTLLSCHFFWREKIHDVITSGKRGSTRKLPLAFRRFYRENSNYFCQSKVRSQRRKQARPYTSVLLMQTCVKSFLGQPTKTGFIWSYVNR